jgi:hypothetical protein
MDTTVELMVQLKHNEWFVNEMNQEKGGKLLKPTTLQHKGLKNVPWLISEGLMWFIRW